MNDYRKVWVRDKLEELAAIFAVDVLGFSIMSNHIHVLLSIRPDVAQDWSKEDIARVDTIERFGRTFRRAIGRVTSMATFAGLRGKCWFQGISASRMAFG